VFARPAEPNLISVVIPAFNYGHFLPQALEGALAQAGVDLEVIVVDDGSTDETSEVLRHYGSNIRVLRQANQGLSAARNSGIAMARGGFLVFLDADDLLPPGALISQFEFLRDHAEIGLAVCRTAYFEECDPNGSPKECGRWRLFLHDLDVHLCHFNVAPPHAFMIRRQALQAAGPFDTSLKACEDHDLWFRAIREGESIMANPELEVAYRRHSGSMSHNLANQWLHDALLHERIARALRTDELFPPCGRMEGLLASLAGCLFTASRLAPTRSDMARRLLDLATDTARQLGSERPAPGRRPATLEYFALRTFMSLAEALRLGSTWARDLVNALPKLLRSRGEQFARFEVNEIEAMAENAVRELT
jgi:GT2 family glycosyltransferase